MRAAILTLCLLLSSVAHAAPKPLLDDSQWTPTTRLWLARAMIGEGGWLAERDHVGFAWVFYRRWLKMRERWPEMRFVDVVRFYAKSLGDGRSQPTDRQVWVRGLLGDEAPPGWPAKKARWSRHVVWWQKTLERTDKWRLGLLRDPCRGRAYNFGGSIDVEIAEQKGLREVDCGDTESIFYDAGSGL